MSVFDSIENLIVMLFQLHGKFYPFEQEIVLQIAYHLEPEASTKLQLQLSQANHYSRDPHGKSVSMYFTDWFWKPQDFDAASLFNETRPPFRIAAVNISRPNSKASLRAEAWIVGGHLFEITYNKSPFVFFGKKRLDKIDFKIDKVTILSDPSKNPFDGARKQTISETCQQQVDALLGVAGSSEFVSPFEAGFIFQAITDYIKFLPPDYVKLLSLTNGCKVGNLSVYGVETINSIVMEDTAILAFAEVEGNGVFAVEQNRRNKNILFYDYIDHESESLGPHLATAFSNKIKQLSARDSTEVPQ